MVEHAQLQDRAFPFGAPTIFIGFPIYSLHPAIGAAPHADRQQRALPAFFFLGDIIGEPLNEIGLGMKLAFIVKIANTQSRPAGFVIALV
jgi:hypothetical protein